MNVFSYHCMDEHGRSVAGRMSAVDAVGLEEKLRALGLWLVDAKVERTEVKAKASGRRWGLWGSAKRRELINFSTLMSFQLKAGITVVTALQVAAEDCENARFRAILQEIKQQVEAGTQMNEALAKFPKLFAPQFISLIRAGEQSGAVPEAFLELKRYMEWQEQIIADVRQATIYPVIVLLVVCFFVLALFTFVIPQFVVLLSSVKVALPLPTRVMFGVSGFAKATWWLWLLGLIAVPMGIQLGRRYSPAFAVFFDRVKFKLPIFGQLNHMLAIARYAHNLAVLYRSGVMIVEALKLCRGLVGSVLLAKVVEDVARGVEAGETLSEAMRRHEIFPGLLLRMAAMGEKTGNLDHALENVSDYYNQVIPRRIKKIFSIVEPMLIVFLVFLVGSVALSIFLPIIALMGAIH